MATIVTLDQTVRSLTTDLGASNTQEINALNAALINAGISTGGSGPSTLPNGNVVITTASLPTPGPFAMGSSIKIASFEMPRAGKICIVGNCSFAAASFSGSFDGGGFLTILQTATPITSNAGLNPVPNNSVIASVDMYNSTGFGGVLAMTVSVGNCTVAQGDVITLSGQVLNIGTGTGTWMIADSVYSPAIRTTGGNTFSYFYIE